MADVVVCVPADRWAAWLAEGDLPGEPAQFESHYWFAGIVPRMQPGDRVYIVAHGRLRGYAPLVRIEGSCQLAPDRHCLVRAGGAVAVTLDRPFASFRGWRYVRWRRSEELPFLDWKTAGVPQERQPASRGGRR